MGAETRAQGTRERFQRQREKTKADLLESARRVLAKKGYHRTKVADIARDADVAVGTFYLYYATKEALFVELVEDAVRLLTAEFQKTRAMTSDPRLRARAALEGFFRFAQAHRELFRITFGHSATFHDVVQRTQKLFVADIAANLAEGMQQHVFRPNDPTVLAQAFVGLSLDTVSWWLDQQAVSLASVTESLLDFVFHGIESSPSSSDS
jgi:AcrR family transcriptional regulator